MTTEQITQAIAMHESGLTTWPVIAAYFKVRPDQLRTQIKRYEQTNSKIHSTP